MRVILVLFLYLLLNGCASFQQHKLSTIDLSKSIVSQKHELAYFNVVVIDAHGNESHGANGVIQNKLQTVIENSSIFDKVYLSNHNKDTYFEFLYSSEANLLKAGLTGAISGVTFTLFPVFVTDPWVLTVRVYKNGSFQKEYVYRDEIRTWFHLTMIFVAPFKPIVPATYELFDNMASNFLVDFSKESGVREVANLTNR